MSENSYPTAGVDPEKADRLVHWLQKEAGSSTSGNVIDGIGGFAAVFQPHLQGWKEPLLVSCTDGVGTKLALAKKYQRLENTGRDLVAMCINDLYTTGATPLFFLDYFSCERLSVTDFQSVMRGILAGLQQAGCVLLGGETAQLPGFYRNANFDLAGFVVGIVDKENLLSLRSVQSGDLLIAFASSGFHSNGFSLLQQKLSPAQQRHYLDFLLKPTTIYTQLVAAGKKYRGLRALAHITGGGIAHNLRRVLPVNAGAEINTADVPTPSWMQDVISLCSLRDFTTAQQIFNMGVGMIAVTAPDTEISGGIVIGKVKESKTQEIVFL